MERRVYRDPLLTPLPHQPTQSREVMAQEGQPSATQHPATILVSSTRKPMSYINLAKRFLSEHGEVHLSALGVAIGPMVTVAEILKSRHLAVVTKLRTSLEDVTVDQRLREKPKMDIILARSPDFDAVISQESSEGKGDTQKEEQGDMPGGS
ncbi:g4667 [Coccomyxa viridis]|uniref:G4667 protein n=1 Tax=Coccomyxa viridis TaxID=1274662 RepID=A0ABP1FW36_9CHLO